MENNKGKKLILKIIAWFTGLVLIITFFSRTIYNFGLPNVTVDYAKSGSIVKRVSGQGIIELVEQQNYYSDNDGKITLFFSEGDEVKKAEKLYEISYEDEDSNLKTVKAYAMEDCLITSSYTNTGAKVTKNMPILTAATLNKAYIVKIGLLDNYDFINKDSKVKLSIKSAAQYNIEGLVKKVRYENGMKNIYIEFEGTGLMGGELAEINAINVSERYDYVIPNSAVRRDSIGSYILTVTKKQGAFGDEYIANRLNVFIIDYDDTNSAISIGGEFTEPIIINSDRIVYIEDKVRLVDGSDIDETR